MQEKLQIPVLLAQPAFVYLFLFYFFVFYSGISGDSTMDFQWRSGAVGSFGHDRNDEDLQAMDCSTQHQHHTMPYSI